MESVTQPNNDDNINIPGVDTAKGLSLYDGEQDIYLEILRSYVSTAPAAIEKIRTVTEETLSEYTLNIHGIKGACASIGAEALREAALNLETMSRAGNLQGVIAENESFIKNAESVITNVVSWLEKHDKG